MKSPLPQPGRVTIRGGVEPDGYRWWVWYCPFDAWESDGNVFRACQHMPYWRFSDTWAGATQAAQDHLHAYHPGWKGPS